MNAERKLACMGIYSAPADTHWFVISIARWWYRFNKFIRRSSGECTSEKKVLIWLYAISFISMNKSTSAWDYILLVSLFQSRSSVWLNPISKLMKLQRNSSIQTNQLTTLYYILNDVAMRAINKRWDHNLKNLTWLTLNMCVCVKCVFRNRHQHPLITGTILRAGLTLQKRPRSTRNWLRHCTCVSTLVASGNQTMHTSTGLYICRDVK